MAKLDWSRVSVPSFDPARYQQRDDFLTPDKPTKPKRKKRKPSRALAPALLRKQAAHNSRINAPQEDKKRNNAASAAKRFVHRKKNAATKAERRALAIKQRLAAEEKKRLKGARRKSTAEARRVASEEYKKTPEYAAKLAREQARRTCERAEMAAKKKSHLQAWIEQETGLDADRELLREQWRERLLKRSTAQK